MNRYRIGAPRGGAALICACLTAGCVGGPGGGVIERETYVASYDRAHKAGLAVLDAVAPTLGGGVEAPYAAVLGPGRLDSGSCEGRYEAEALRARCAALASILAYNEALKAEAAGWDSTPYRRIAAQYLFLLSRSAGALSLALEQVGAAERLIVDIRSSMKLKADAPAIRDLISALQADAPRLYELERAARAERLLVQDHRFLAAMDEVFDAVNGRSSPAETGARGALDRLSQRLTPLLAREAPAYGARSIFEVMQAEGSQLSAREIEALTPHLAEAEDAVAAFDGVAAEWRRLAEAIRVYDQLLAEVGATLGGGGAESVVALHDRASEIIGVLWNLNRETSK